MTGTLLALVLTAAHAKRVLPPALKPIRYRAKVFMARVEPTPAGFVGVVVASEKSREVWRTKLFERIYKNDLETDVQEIAIAEFTREGERLKVVDERRGTYLVDVKDGRLIDPLNPRFYPMAK